MLLGWAPSSLGDPPLQIYTIVSDKSCFLYIAVSDKRPLCVLAIHRLVHTYGGLCRQWAQALPENSMDKQQAEKALAVTHWVWVQQLKWRDLGSHFCRQHPWSARARKLLDTRLGGSLVIDLFWELKFLKPEWENWGFEWNARMVVVLQEKPEVLFYSRCKISCDNSQYSVKVDLIIT